MSEKNEKTMFDYMLEDKDENPVWELIARIFWYRSIKRIPDMFRRIKWFFQRMFRPYHASDCDLWGLADHLAPIILGKLKAFRAYPLHGYPANFCEYAENEWESREKYDEALAKGDVVGGEFEAWLKTLDEMIFAFDFITHYEASDKKRDAMLKRYGLKYPHQKIPENRQVHYAYRTKSGNFMSSHLPPNDPDNADHNFLGEEISYYNFDLEKEYYERVQGGLNLFAKYFMNLWD